MEIVVSQDVVLFRYPTILKYDRNELVIVGPYNEGGRGVNELSRVIG